MTKQHPDRRLCRFGNLKEEIAMHNTKNDEKELIELNNKLLAPFIERAQLVQSVYGLELVRYSIGENVPGNDQECAFFYTRRIDTKEVVDSVVSIDEILIVGLLMMFVEMMRPHMPEKIA